MANADIVRGLVPVRTLSGSPIRSNLYYIPSTDNTAVFVGDAVKLAGSASTDGYATVAQAAAGNSIVGVVTGFEPDETNLGLLYRQASTARYVWVADQIDLICEVQASAGMDVTDVGAVADIVVGSGNTTYGTSGMELNSGSLATGSAATLQVLRIINRPDNEAGTNAKVEVRINEHQYANGANGV